MIEISVSIMQDQQAYRAKVPMPEISIAEATSAASDLVRTLNNTPGIAPQSHSVYVKTETGPKGEFVRSICVSEHPKWKGKLSIPTEHHGIPVVKVAWPKGQ